ncbi:MAG: DUF6538 domain-containing protein [Azonexus sp.]
MQYLLPRGEVWWFSRRAPKPLKSGNRLTLDDVETKVQANGYIRFSLKTSSRKEATRLARKFAHLVDEAADQRKNRKPKYAAIEGTPSAYEIEQAAERMYATLLAADDATAANAIRAALAREEVTREPDRYQWSVADLPPETLEGEVELLQQLAKLANFYIYQSCRKTISEITPELAPFASAFRRLVAALEERKKGLRVPTPEMANTDTDILFSVLYERFREHRTQNKLWKRPETSHTRDYYPIVKEFIAIVGDKPISKLAKADARKYAEHTMRRTDNGLGTKSRNFDRIKAILHFGEKHFDIASITSPLEVEGGYKRVHQSYKRFTKNELKALFESEDYKNNTFKKPSQFWMPLLGLYTGARIAELAGLELDKIQTFFGYPCYFLSHPEGDNEGGKNEFAPRWVPVHPALISAGFIEYVELLRAEGHTRLFPCLGKAARDGYAKRATEDFIQYRRTCGVGAAKGEGRSAQAYHSFRATLVSAMVERGIDGDTRRALVGHASNEALGVNDRRDVHDIIYDQSEVQIKKLSKALSRISFSLTHSKYLDSRKMKTARRFD